ncbi:molecular chaperone [Ignatzschineria ureiclastica]|uniref:Molecular chaperone n=1 Tax=Ignatzschineria ureiclastica TaxID=472582 RepID=A0A2U2AEP7_9GAMM|nr:molecular chaperone [Ignatzschineria ureiclastica]PWD81123.1 molecular chaperone [Ignatzschineria ureiclastica]GGZ96410.1 fimbrial protein StfD [Ignatzschineria ureiclastica]
MKKRLFILAIALLNVSFAQLTLDRTRIIFDKGQTNSQSIVVTNTSKTEPFLAQSWMEDEHNRKIESPLVALPILQRVNPGQNKQVKISLAGQDNLPTDRESLLYFNVLGVPPKNNQIENQLNIAIQSKVKLFYRPKGLKKYANNDWLKEMQVNKNGNSYILENPTPYHFVIFAVSNGSKGKLQEDDIIVKPFGKSTVNRSLGNNPTFYFINDFGGTVSQSYQCNGNHCTLMAESN